MKTTLISIPFFEKKFSWNEEGTGTFQPPLGLAYLAGVLEKNNFKVDILDAPPYNLTEEEFKKEIIKRNPDIVGFTSVIVTYPQLKKSIKLVKEVKKECKIVVGGPNADKNYKLVMEENKDVDFIIKGEAEYTYLELVNELESKEPNFSKILGLVYRENGEMKVNANRPLIQNLDELPFPARHLIENLNNPKVYTAMRHKRLPMATMMTGRGCPYDCIFCYRIFGRQYRANSPEYVVNEIKHLQEKYNIREVYFYDDHFLVNTKRVKEICKLIKQEKIDLTWSCLGRVDSISRDREVLPEMKSAGCWYVAYGIESGNQKVLDYIKKGITLQQVREAIKESHKNKIRARGFFMLGHPIDTKQTINETINFAKSLPLEEAQFSFNIPYPGTELYDIALKEGKYDAEAYEDMAGRAEMPVYVPDGLTKEYLMKMQRKAYKEFYIRPWMIYKHVKTVDSFSRMMKLIRKGLIYL